jgi:DNA-binding response OmpR family regulator
MQKILIVDDDQPTRDGLALLLEDSGFEAVTAGTVPVALKLLADERPDLLIVDIRLDEYNGLQLVAMRKEPIPAVVLTGYHDSALEADARQLGAEYLLKPVEPAALTTLVKRLIGDGTSAAFPRRWSRKAVRRDIVVDIDNMAARMMDVSYGGVCLELQGRSGAAEPPEVFRLIVPTAERPVPVEVVWTRRRDETTWMCGGIVIDGDAANWRTLVDSWTS